MRPAELRRCISILLPFVFPLLHGVPCRTVSSSKNVVSSNTLTFGPRWSSGDQCRAPDWCSWVSFRPPHTIGCCISSHRACLHHHAAHLHPPPPASLHPTPRLPLDSPATSASQKGEDASLLFVPGAFGWGEVGHLDMSLWSSSWGPANSLSSDRRLNLSKCL